MALTASRWKADEAKRSRQAVSGIINDISLGAHLCMFYQTRSDLVDILVPYFKAGLENDELCMWVTSKPLETRVAKASLKRAVR